MRGRAPVRGMRHSLFFWEHNHAEGGATDESKSKYNDEEACMAVRLAKHLLLQVPPPPLPSPSRLVPCSANVRICPVHSYCHHCVFESSLVFCGMMQCFAVRLYRTERLIPFVPQLCERKNNSVTWMADQSKLTVSLFRELVYTLFRSGILTHGHHTRHTIRGAAPAAAEGDGQIQHHDGPKRARPGGAG